MNFVPESTFPLFASMGRVVPGDSRTEHVWVMNNSSSAALLRVDMVDPIADDAYLAAAFSLNVFPTGGTRSSVTIAQGIDNGACTVLDAGIRLGAGERLRLDLTADVGRLSPPGRAHAWHGGVSAARPADRGGRGWARFDGQ